MPRTDPRGLSYWLATIADAIEPSPPLVGSQHCDVAIVGAGYAGLWTAYSLKCLDPTLDVRLVEAAFAGRGAAGRNGGWCSLDLPNYHGLIRDEQTRSRAIELMPWLIDAVDQVGQVAVRERIDCDYHKGGMAHVATSPEQLVRAKRGQEFLTEIGLGHVQEWLEQPDMARRIRMTGNLGGTFSPHCAALHPAKLARGLAATVVRMGVQLYEQSPATRVEPGQVTTPAGTLKAEKVVLATEGYTRAEGSPHLPRRRLLAMHSFMTVTEPLPESFFAEIGLADRECFGDYSWLVTYGQRTADDRLAFGYGGRTYPDGRPRDTFRAGDPQFRLVQDMLERQFPALDGTRYTQSWGGAMGMSRNQTPFVEYDPRTGTGWLGGFFGNGVAATNLGGRAMADLVLERQTALTGLDLLVRMTTAPLQQHPRWEWGPVAWSGASATLRALRRRDRLETGV